MRRLEKFAAVMTLVAIAATAIAFGSDGFSTFEIAAIVLIVVGAVASTPLRLRNVEQQLIKKKLSVDVIEEAGKLVSESIKPITDIRGTAEYRLLASKGIAMEALTRILENSRREK